MKAFSQDKRFEEEHVGIAAATSDEWLRYRSYVEIAEPSEIVDGLKDKNPAVRTYLAWHIVNELPESVAKVLPLIDDPQPVDWMSGCIVMPMSVQRLVLIALCRRARTDASIRPLLEDIRKGPHAEKLREGAASCLTTPEADAAPPDGGP